MYSCKQLNLEITLYFVKRYIYQELPNFYSPKIMFYEDRFISILFKTGLKSQKRVTLINFDNEKMQKF